MSLNFDPQLLAIGRKLDPAVAVRAQHGVALHGSRGGFFYLPEPGSWFHNYPGRVTFEIAIIAVVVQVGSTRKACKQLEKKSGGGAAGLRCLVHVVIGGFLWCMGPAEKRVRSKGDQRV